jgi:sulfane dehydrogenase subunit SoxC
MTRSIPMEKALDDCLVAFKMNGEALRAEQGYPLRLCRSRLGRQHVGQVAAPPGSRRSAMASARGNLEIHRPSGNEERPGALHWVMDVKSVITSPSPQAPITHGKGPMVITGLAWSGNGRIKRVDVSIDGGRNWQTARIDGPSLSQGAAPILSRHQLGRVGNADAIPRNG